VGRKVAGVPGYRAPGVTVKKDRDKKRSPVLGQRRASGGQSKGHSCASSVVKVDYIDDLTGEKVTRWRCAPCGITYLTKEDAGG
jgi:hypothetical protein